MWKNIVTVCTLAALAIHCAEAPPAPRADPPAEPTASAAEAAPQAAPTAPKLTDDERVKRYLSDLRDKQKCNKVMGCEPAIGLAQYGTKAVPAILTTLAGQAIDGRYWQLKAFDILGQLGDTRATPVLQDALSQSRWEVRCRGALALARIGDPKSAAPVRALLARDLDVASNAAALFALARLKQSVDGLSARKRLIEILPRTQAALGELNPGHFAFLAELVGAAQLRESLQLTRWGAMHKDRFTRMSSLETLALLKDREGVPYAVTRLDDPSPGVKRQALRTLRVITGKRAFTKPEHWKDWCEQRQCLAPLKALRDSAPAGGSVQPSGEDPSAGDVRGDKDDLR